MGASLALEATTWALLQALKASPVSALVPAERIGDEVLPRPTYPYILVEANDAVAFNTMGDPDRPKWGETDRISVRVVSQFRGDAEASQIGNAVREALDGRTLSVPGYPTAHAQFERAVMVKGTLATGITTRELVIEFSVLAHQS